MSNERKKRNFRIVATSHDDNVNLTSGTYEGRGPGQAARKAFSKYCEKAEIGTCVRRFTIEEITRGSNKKQFHYVGTRKRLDPPKQILRSGKKYWVHYEVTVHKAA